MCSLQVRLPIYCHRELGQFFEFSNVQDWCKAKWGAYLYELQGNCTKVTGSYCWNHFLLKIFAVFFALETVCHSLFFVAAADGVKAF